MGKSDQRMGGGSSGLKTTTSKTTLAAINVTSSVNFKDGLAYVVLENPVHLLYILNRNSSAVADGDNFIATNVAGVIWEKQQGLAISQDSLRGTFDITTNPAQYPKGLASSAINATQTGNGSGAGPTIQAGDYWYVINNGGTDTIGPATSKTITTNNAIIIALVDNATNAHADWTILENTLTADGPAGTPSLRTLGTGTQQAAAGNDPRLADARVPLQHAPTHKHGGTDEIATATAAANEIPKADSFGKLDTWISSASTAVAGKIAIALQATVDTGTDNTQAVTSLTLSTNPRIPSQSENDALQGTNGTPSNTNRYVTNSDPRLGSASPIGSALNSSQIYVGNVSNQASAVTVTGDLSLSNTGVATIPSSFITSKTTVTPASGDFLLVADVSDSNNLKKVLISSLPAGSSVLNSGQIFVGNISNIATGVPLSGDATLSNTGVITISANVVSNAKLRFSTGLSVMGRSASSNGQVEDIIATANGQVLQMKAGSLVFDTAPGGGSDSDYNDLSNKPSINGVELTGDQTSDELGLADENHTHPYLPLTGGTVTGDVDFSTAGFQTAITESGVKVFAAGFGSDDITEVRGGYIYMKSSTSAFEAEILAPTNNSAKVELQLPNLSGTLALISDIPGSVANASESVAGKVEEATDAEVQGNTSVGGTGARLVLVVAKLWTWWTYVKTQANTWAAQQTFTLAPRFSSGTASKIVKLDSNKDFTTGDVALTEMADQAGLTVLANATNATGKPTAVAASVAERVFVRTASNTLAFIQLTANYIAALAIGTGHIANNAITLGKMAQLAANKLIGNITGLTSDPQPVDILDISTALFKRVTTATNYATDGTERVVGISNTSSPRIITLGSASAYIPGQPFTIKDESGGAGTNNITISPSGSDTIDVGTTINSNGGSKTYYSDGISKFFNI